MSKSKSPMRSSFEAQYGKPPSQFKTCALRIEAIRAARDAEHALNLYVESEKYDARKHAWFTAWRSREKAPA